jgi:hypothetical protein
MPVLPESSSFWWAVPALADGITQMIHVDPQTLADDARIAQQSVPIGRQDGCGST